MHKRTYIVSGALYGWVRALRGRRRNAEAAHELAREMRHAQRAREQELATESIRGQLRRRRTLQRRMEGMAARGERRFDLTDSRRKARNTPQDRARSGHASASVCDSWDTPRNSRTRSYLDEAQEPREALASERACTDAQRDIAPFVVNPPELRQ